MPSSLQVARGKAIYFAWVAALLVLIGVGILAYLRQYDAGLIATNMRDQVSWGFYIGNFTFLVGVAAAAVLLVIPAYVYHWKPIKEVVILGELLAISAIVMCGLFVTVDVGHPLRVWHMLPIIGTPHLPQSLLAWDMLVLNAYLILNLLIVTYLLFSLFRGVEPRKSLFVPLVLLSIPAAIGIHTVTAFLYCGLGGRPFWNTSLLAPKFLTSAFVSGPAFIIIVLQLIRRLTSMKVGEGSIRTLVGIMRITILINLLMTASEIFTIFYTGGSHAQAGNYLYFGHGEQNALVPWIWTSIGMSVVAAVLLLRPKVYRHLLVLDIACVLAFVGIWIEKGMGLIIPGFIPSTLHEIVEYMPSATEWKVTAGIWAAGLLVYTVLLKVASPIFVGKVTIHSEGKKKSS